MKTRTALIAAFLGSVVAANYAIAHIGSQPDPLGPHVLPVWFGISAPSGVYVAGLTLVLRDLVQRRSHGLVTFGAILAGAALSALFSPSLAIASGLAFLISESVDFATFSLTERFGLAVAVIASNAVSLVVDSVVFLSIAYNSLAFVEGQIIGKAWATLAGLGVILALRPRRAVTA